MGEAPPLICDHILILIRKFMPNNNEQKVFVITDSNEVTNSGKLFENNNEVLGFSSIYINKFSNSIGDDMLSSHPASPTEDRLENNIEKRVLYGIPTIFLNEFDEMVFEIPLVVKNLFEIEYGIGVKYDSKNLLLQFDYDATNSDSAFKQSKIAKNILVKELKKKNNKNSLVFGGPNLTWMYQGKKIPTGPAVTEPIEKNITYVDLSYFNEANLQFTKMFNYVNFPSDEYFKRTTNLGRVFEHDFVFHNVKSKNGTFEDSNKGSYRPGSIESNVNEIRIEIGLENYVAYNYMARVEDRFIKYFGNKTHLKEIKNFKDVLKYASAFLTT